MYQFDCIANSIEKTEREPVQIKEMLKMEIL